MSKALAFAMGEEASGTTHFVSMIDHFFDCLNVNNFNTGKFKRKPFQNPYRSADNFRLKVLDPLVAMMHN